MNDQEQQRQRRVLSIGGCSCHINPPCGFCTELDEEESEAYLSGGINGLELHFIRKNNPEEAPEKSETT